MSRMSWNVFAGACAIVAAGTWMAPAGAQMAEVREKPRMYTYEANWNIPRARWAEMEKPNPGNQKILDKAIAGGEIVAYGSDSNLLHEADGATHDSWWSSMSMAGTLNVLDEFEKSGDTTTSLFASATKHWDNMWVTRYYNWHAGSWKGAYTYASAYTLKPDAPDDAVDILAKGFIVPCLEKLLAEGAIVEYEIDTQAIHSDPPGIFVIDFIAPNAEGIDKVQAALRDANKNSPLAGPAVNSMVDWSRHHDFLMRTTATYK